jgi:hypothetical protein
MIRKKHQLFQRAKQTERTEDCDKYRLQKRATQKAVRQAHWSCVNNVLESVLEEGNSKPFGKYIKSKRTDIIGVAGIKKNGILHQDSKSKAELLSLNLIPVRFFKYVDFSSFKFVVSGFAICVYNDHIVVRYNWDCVAGFY